MAEDAGVFQDIDDDHHADQEHDRVGALLAAIRDHKPDFIHALTVWPGIATLRRDTLEWCQPLTPDDPLPPTGTDDHGGREY